MLEQKLYSQDMETKPKLTKKYAGRLGGLVGGKARAEKLTKEQRKEIAKKAAKARWEKKKAEAA